MWCECASCGRLSERKEMCSVHFLSALFAIIASLGPHLSEAQVTGQRSRLALYSLALPHKDSLADLLDRVTDVSIGQRCRESLVEFADGLRANERNALVMLDSFAKMKPGLFSHQFTDFGNYQQCLTKTDPPARYVVLEIAVDCNGTEYFLEPADQEHYLFQKPLAAICVPGACSESDVSSVVTSQLVSSLAHPYSLRVLTSELKDEDQFTEHVFLRHFCRLVLFSIVAFNLVSTYLVMVSPLYSSHKIISNFNLLQNTRDLFKDPHPSEERTLFLHGTRVTFLFGGILTHFFCFLSPAVKPYFHSIYASVLSSEFLTKLFQVLCSSMQANIQLSSILIVVSWAAVFKWKKGNVSFSMYLFNRLFRTLPVVTAWALIVGSLPWSTSLGGPLMNYIQKTSVHLLVTNGWKQFAFISYLDNIDKMFMPIGWFISVDTIIYAASYPVVYFMFNRPKLGVYLALLMWLGGMVIHWAHIWTSGAPSFFFHSLARFHEVYNSVEKWHFSPNNYIALYAIGLLFGFCLVNKVELFKGRSTKFYAISLTLAHLVRVIPSLLYDAHGRTQLSRTMKTNLDVLLRLIIFSADLSILYYFWLYPSSFLSKILSSKPMVVISRITFSTFVIHPLFMILQFAMDTETKYSLWEICIRFVFTSYLSLIAGYLLYIFVECPFNRLRFSMSKGRETRLEKNSFVDKIK